MWETVYDMVPASWFKFYIIGSLEFGLDIVIHFL